jgi:hypothetical protein
MGAMIQRWFADPVWKSFTSIKASKPLFFMLKIFLILEKS